MGPAQSTSSVCTNFFLFLPVALGPVRHIIGHSQHSGIGVTLFGACDDVHSFVHPPSSRHALLKGLPPLPPPLLILRTQSFCSSAEGSAKTF